MLHRLWWAIVLWCVSLGCFMCRSDGRLTTADLQLYRCYLVWGGRFSIVAFPLLLLMGSIGAINGFIVEKVCVC